MPPKMSPPKALPKPAAVKMRPDLAAFLSSLPEGRQATGAPPRPWTPDEDAFLLAARERGAYWHEIADRLHVAEGTARRRWRELAAKK